MHVSFAMQTISSGQIRRYTASSILIPHVLHSLVLRTWTSDSILSLGLGLGFGFAIDDLRGFLAYPVVVAPVYDSYAPLVSAGWRV